MVPAACKKHGVERESFEERPKWEVADIFREHGQAYRRDHSLPLSHLKVMHAIEVCRTASLGGHIEECDSCGFERISYNSCCNRHCTKCQALTKAKWLEQRKEELLPVGYFHNVFTLPHEINPIVLCNKKVVFDILFRAVADTLKTFGGNPDNGLGGKIGFIAILHTWDQTLMDHFHIHVVIPAGALSFDEKRWISSREDFLFPVKALSEVFRGKFIHFLKEAFDNGLLSFPGNTAPLGTKKGFSQLMEQLRERDWVVYSKKPFAGPVHVLDYLGRYTHRVAISNNRIISLEDGRVSFKYRDRKDNDELKIMTLKSDEFIRRFLLHVLPGGFMRIRHYGILANCCKNKDIGRCRELLGLSPDLPKPVEKTAHELMLELTGIDLSKCPRCKLGRMVIIAEIPKASKIPFEELSSGVQVLDSS